jgi:hypothetical protein
MLSSQADRQAGPLRLRWTEAGGPSLDHTSSRRGFGPCVVEALVGNQLGGTLARCWNPDGLTCEIALPLIRAVTKPRETNGQGVCGAAERLVEAAGHADRDVRAQAAR